MYLRWAEAPKHGFPPQLLKLLISIYTGERFVTFRGVVSELTVVTFSAVVAGSTGGTRCLKLAILAVTDSLSRLCPTLFLKWYVDDLSLQARGSEEEVSEKLCDGIHMYVEAMEARGIPVSRARPGGPPRERVCPGLQRLPQAWNSGMGPPARARGPGPQCPAGGRFFGRGPSPCPTSVRRASLECPRP